MSDFGQRRTIAKTGVWLRSSAQGVRAGTALALVLGLGLHAGAAGAQIWTGGTSTDWFDGTNWLGGTAPTPATGPTINDGAAPFQPTLNADATVFGTMISAGTLTIDSGAILTSPSVNISATGALVASGGSQILGSVNTGDGSLTLDASSATVVTVSGLGTYTATGAVTHESLSVFGSLTGTGTITTTDFEVLGGTVAPTVTVESLRSAIADTSTQADATRLFGTGATSATLANRAGGAVTNAAASAVRASAPVVAIDLADTVSGTIGIDATATDVPGASLTITSTSTITGTTGAGVLARSTAATQSITTNTVTGATNGIDAASTAAGGTITMVANGDVTGTGGTGIIASTDGAGIDVTVGAASTITGGTGRGIDLTIVNGAGQTARVQGSSGDVVGATDGIAMNSGGAAIVVDNLDSVTGNAGSGLNLTSGGGTVTVTAVDAITGTGGNGILVTSGGGNVSIQGSGTVGGITGTGGSGINLTSGSGNIDIGGTTLNGAISGAGAGIGATTTGGSVVITTGGAGTVTAGANGIGTSSQTGATTLTLNAAVTGGGLGVTALTTTGVLGVTGSGAVSGATGGIAAFSTSGAVTVSGTGTTTATGANGTAIEARITGGAATADLLVNRSGAIVAGGGGSFGVLALNSGTGNVTVTGAGPISFSAASTGIGIDARSFNATGGNVAVTTGGTIDGGATGIRATNAGTGTASVTVDHAIGTTTAPTADGVRIETVDGAGSATVNAAVTSAGDGVDVVATGSGAIGVSGDGAITGATSGIRAASGSGGVTVTGNGAISVTDGAGTGVSASSGGGGNLSITRGGPIDGGGVGIEATTTGAGTVAITVNGVIGGATAPGGTGVLSSAQGGATTIDLNANVTAGAAGTGVSANSASGPIAVNVNGATVLRGGATGLAMSAGTGTATATIAAGATVQVDTAAGGQAVALATAAGGAASATNAGNVVATNTPASTAVTFAGAGTGSFTNQAGGVVQGMLASSAGAGAFTVNNDAGGAWTLNTGGTSDLAGTDDRFNNSGILNATGPITLAGLEQFNNDGTFNIAGAVTLGAASAGTLIADNAGGTLAMQNGATGDVLTITGNFANTAPGTVTMDVDLSAANAGSADRITATGTASGTVNLALTALPGGLQVQTPITLISAADLSGLTVNPTAAGFTLGGGGLIEYAVQTNAANTQVDLVGVLNPGAVGLAANIGVVSALVGTIVNRPSSAFVGGIAFESADNCSTGGWARAIGGQARGTAASVAGGGAARDSTVRTGYGGIQGGFDFGCFNAFEGGWDIAAGVTFGLNDGSTKQDVVSLGGVVTSTTSGSFSQRYAGAYLAFARGQVFGDLQLRADSTRFTFSNPAIGLLNDELKTSSRGISGSVSYSMPLDGDLSFVPTAGFGITRTKGGTITYSGPPGGTLAVDPHTSQVVFAGATLARSTFGEAGDSATNQFVTGTIYSDVSSDRTATFTPGGGGLPIPVSTGNLGTFGEISLGVSYLRILDGQSIGAAKQLDASIRADARFSKRVNSVGLTAQMRLQF